MRFVRATSCWEYVTGRDRGRVRKIGSLPNFPVLPTVRGPKVMPGDEFGCGLDALEHSGIIDGIVLLRLTVCNLSRGSSRKLVEHEPLKIQWAVLMRRSDQTARFRKLPTRRLVLR